MTDPADRSDYRFGIEEEYFIVDRKTGAIRAEMSRAYLAALQKSFGPRVMTEMLQCQLEIATEPVTSPQEAREQLLAFRTGISEIGRSFDAGIIAAGTHPNARGAQMQRTRKRRYDKVISDLQLIGMTNALSGLHVHVEMPDPDQRVRVMYRMIPYLHLFLALSSSSPFWEGQDSGLMSYRTAGNRMLPRSGLPELFRSLEEYSRYVDTLAEAKVIPDASYVWWCIRPSLRHPTLELRVMDSCTSVHDAVALASLYRCLVRHLCCDETMHDGLSPIDRALAEENMWRALRYGTAASFLDADRGATPFRAELARVIDLVKDDAEALGIADELTALKTIAQRGTSAHRQVAIYKAMRDAGKAHVPALREVVRWLRLSTELGDLVTADTAASAPPSQAAA